MKKVKIIGMVLAVNFIFEIGKTLIKNKMVKSVLNESSNSRNTMAIDFASGPDYTPYNR